jgi:curved DNA-binding protein CbpA
MEGQLNEHPLAELIREIAAQKMYGALRLVRERARVAIYFEDGRLVFAASNLRPHRLREVLKRAGLANVQPDQLPNCSDDELSRALIESGRLTKEKLFKARCQQVSDVLRTALLWTNGSWKFDRRVRLADDVRVRVDVTRLLLECARHLPADFVASRFNDSNGISYLNVANGETTKLSPAETFVLSRANGPVSASELTALNNLSDQDGLRAVYGLSLSGLLQRSEWPTIFGQIAKQRRKTPQVHATSDAAITDDQADETGDVEDFLSHLQSAKDHYQVLDVARLADSKEIKRAYHRLARRYHPDRFHQSKAELRARVDSAFARIAQAYETLSESTLRAAYDAKLKKKGSTANAPTRAETTQASEEIGRNEAGPKSSDAGRAESSFRQGLAALERNERELAIRLLAEAAMLQPRNPLYRANYGHALIGTTNARRLAESELQTAVSLEPNNAAHRVMLAELYERLGLHRRARGELERALAADPKNEAARKLLANTKSKN